MSLVKSSKLNFDSAIIHLTEIIKEYSESIDKKSNPSSLRFEIELTDIDPLVWLAGQNFENKFYYRSRPNGSDIEEIAGIGIADQIKVENSPVDYSEIINQISNKLQDADPACRYFGGFGFHANSDHDDSSFRDLYGVVNLVLPRFELIRRDNKSLLSVNIFLSELENQKNLSELLNDLSNITNYTELPKSEIPTVIGRKDLPDKKTWCGRVEKCVVAIDNDELEKIVLARKSTFSFTRGLNPWTLLDGFRDKDSNRFLFAFQPEAGATFISTTPELLYSRSNQNIISEALAGTRPRSNDPDEDTHLGAELMKSRKERREHAFVEQQVAHNLTEICNSEISQSEVSLVKLEHLQHLVVQFKGSLKDNITDADLLKNLHPTPAVGGFPKEKAVDLIRTLETFDRGWYAGPIGWLGKDSATMAVGIRSGTIQDNKLTLYSGAGIVEGSLPVREWAEIENKIAGFLSLLTR